MTDAEAAALEDLILDVQEELHTLNGKARAESAAAAEAARANSATGAAGRRRLSELEEAVGALAELCAGKADSRAVVRSVGGTTFPPSTRPFGIHYPDHTHISVRDRTRTHAIDELILGSVYGWSEWPCRLHAHAQAFRP